jgi:type VI protein secretion system component Hcp
MSDERQPTEPEEPVEDLDVSPDEAKDVKGGAPAATGKPQMQDIHFTHVVDKSSPLL